MKNFYGNVFLNDYENEKKKTVLTKDEALFDLEQFMFFITTGSISFYLMKDELKELLYKKYKEKKKILENLDIICLNQLFDSFKYIVEDIEDFHSMISVSHENEKYFYSFGKKHFPFFTKELFDKNANGFINYEKGEQYYQGKSLENKDCKIKSNIPYFVPTIIDSKIKYRMCVFSDCNKNIEVENFSFFPVSYNWQNLKQYDKEFNTNQSCYWIFPDDTWKKEEREKKYAELKSAAEISSNKKFVIIENRANFGGIPWNQMEIIFSLLGIKNEIENHQEIKKERFLEGSVLVSPLVAKKTLLDIERYQCSKDVKDKLYEFWDEKLNFKNKVYIDKETELEWWEYNEDLQKKIKFKGKIILIINQDTMSWGELIINFIKNVLGYKNVIIIGTNSRGCVAYGNPLFYNLKNSGIDVGLSSVTDVDKVQAEVLREKVETRGVLPDYWAFTEEEIYNTLKFILNEEKL